MGKKAKYAIIDRRYGGFGCIVEARTEREAIELYQNKAITYVDVKNLTVKPLR